MTSELPRLVGNGRHFHIDVEWVVLEGLSLSAQELEGFREQLSPQLVREMIPGELSPDLAARGSTAFLQAEEIRPLATDSARQLAEQVGTAVAGALFR